MKAHVDRLASSLVSEAATNRGLEIGAHLRERKGWLLTSAHIGQSWALHLEGRKYRIDCNTSAFLYSGPSSPGFGFGLNIRPSVLSTPWLEDFLTRLGPKYSANDMREGRDTNLSRVLRKTSEPSLVLRELRHISAAIEGASIVRSRTRARKTPREPHEDMWTIIEALDGTAWRVRGVTHRLERRAQHNGHRWHVCATFIPMVDSFEQRPGFAGMVYIWSRRGKGFNPIAKAADLSSKPDIAEMEMTASNFGTAGLVVVMRIVRL